MNEYDRWAIYYDFIHEGLPGEVDFYVHEALRSGGETLELGCGTGRVCIPMAMSGVSVTGMDLSAPMLALCQEKYRAVGKTKGRLQLFQGDMRAFAVNRRFSFIAMAYRTFMHLLTPEDQVRCLECAFGHLEEGGRLALNVWAARPSAIPRNSPGEEAEPLRKAGSYPVPGEGITLVQYHSARYDEMRQLLMEQHVIQEVNSLGKTLCEERLTLTRAWQTPREMEHLVWRCGFEVEAVLGDFRGAPFNGTQPEMIWILCKPAGGKTRVSTEG